MALSGKRLATLITVKNNIPDDFLQKENIKQKIPREKIA
jgi:hypothetical protein